MPQTEDQTIYQRIEAGKKALKKKVRKDRDYTRRFKDPSAFSNWVYDNDDSNFEDDGENEIPAPAAVGNVPYLQTNIRTKAASICFTNPKWYIETVDPDLSEIPKEILDTLWRERNWVRICKKAYLKRFITGMGCVCCYWKDPVEGKPFGGPTLEHVALKDLAIDPHVVDWNDLRWAARRIMMPRDEALAQWPEFSVELGKPLESGGKNAADDARRSSAVEIWVYWDAETEAVTYGSICLQKDSNLYGCVPLIFPEGDLDPNTEFDSGDFDAATGLQVMMTYLDDMVNNMARHGGSVMLYDTNAFSDKDVKSMEQGIQQGILGVDGDPEGKIWYTPTEPMNMSVLEARRNVQNAVDAAQGVNQYMRGVVQNESKFATEVAATEGQSGARGDQDRKEYENFLERIARMAIRWILQFSKPADESEFMLLDALQQLTKLEVVEQCFVAGTLVDTPNGAVPIESLKVGDFVWSAAGLDKILNIWRRIHKNLYRISTLRGDFYCSPNHPFFVAGKGFVDAANLVEGDILETREAMLAVRDDVPLHSAKGDRGAEKAFLLQQQLLGDSAAPRSCEEGGSVCGRTSTVCKGCSGHECGCEGDVSRAKDCDGEGRKQDAHQSRSGESFRDSQADRQEAACSCGMAWGRARREGPWTDGAPEEVAGGVGGSVGSGVCYSSGQSPQAGSSDLLYAGSGNSLSEGVHRSGWAKPQDAESEGEGSQEGSRSLRVRVEMVTLLEPGCPDGDRYRNSDGEYDLWDIEVEHSPTFFVSGILVHNSTVYKNPQAQFNLATAVLQAFAPYIQAGIVNPIPLIEDVLIAAGKRNVKRYFGLPAPAAPQGAPGQPQPGQPGMPPQSAEGGGGTVPAGPPAAPPMQGGM